MLEKRYVLIRLFLGPRVVLFLEQANPQEEYRPVRGQRANIENQVDKGIRPDSLIRRTNCTLECQTST